MLSHMYPSAVNWTAGIFVHEQVRALARRGHDVRVVSPTGWAPPLLPRWRAVREVPGVDVVQGVPVLHPRKLSLPGGRLGARNGDAMLLSIARPLRRVHERWPFDVIHAHMLVPDGWAAARIFRPSRSHTITSPSCPLPPPLASDRPSGLKERLWTGSRAPSRPNSRVASVSTSGWTGRTCVGSTKPVTSLRDHAASTTVMITEVTGALRQRPARPGCPVNFEEPRCR